MATSGIDSIIAALDLEFTDRVPPVDSFGGYFEMDEILEESPAWKSFPRSVWGEDHNGRKFIVTEPHVTMTEKSEDTILIRRSPITIWERYAEAEDVNPVMMWIPGIVHDWKLPQDSMDEFTGFLSGERGELFLDTYAGLHFGKTPLDKGFGVIQVTENNGGLEARKYEPVYEPVHAKLQEFKLEETPVTDDALLESVKAAIVRAEITAIGV